ncbi:hypothetical protein D3C71_1401210 [compost metagenome]
MDVPQAVVPCMAAAALELDLPWRNVQFVMHHQDFFGLDLEEACQRSHRLAREIHEGLWLQQPDALPMHRRARHQPVVAALGHQRGLEFARQRINPPETGVVAGGFVVWPRVSKAYKQLDHWRDYRWVWGG